MNDPWGLNPFTRRVQGEEIRAYECVYEYGLRTARRTAFFVLVHSDLPSPEVSTALSRFTVAYSCRYPIYRMTNSDPFGGILSSTLGHPIFLRNRNPARNHNPSSGCAQYGVGSSCTRLAEVLRMSPTSIETIPTSMDLPVSAESIRFFATRTSRHAAHSNAEPRAISKNRQRSGAVYFPFPSAIFRGIDVDALSS